MNAKVSSVAVTQTEMQSIVRQLASADACLASAIERHPLCTLAQQPTRQTHLESLVESIVSQQLSVKAAATIFGRLRALLDDEVTPSRLMYISESTMREAGVSGSKFKTIRGLAEAAHNNDLDITRLHELDDAIIREQLSRLWGIGTWTVDMFLLSQLGRLDVWPTGDLGVRRGWQKMYDLPDPVSQRQLEDLGDHLRPYRSVVAWYCWQEVDA